MSNRVQAPITGTEPSAESFDIPWPSTQDGDILFLNVGGQNTILTPEGWTAIASGDINGFQDKAIFAYIADGTETGNITVSRDGVGATEWCWVLDHWRGAASYKISSEAVGNSVSPNSASLTTTPDFSTADVWISTMFLSVDNRTISSYPTNYTGGDDAVQGTHVATCYRELSVETEDPGAYTINNNQNWSAYTIALEPAAGDTTPPTLPADTTLAIATTKDQATVDFDKATADDTDATTDLIYRLWRASAGTDISTAVLCNSNGTEEASGTDVAQLIDSAVPSSATQYEWNITVEDTSGNQTAYTQTSAYTKLGGNVTRDATAEQDANIVIFDLDTVGLDLNGLGSPIEVVASDASGDWEMTTAFDPNKTYFDIVLHIEVEESGTATGGTSNTLTDTGLSMTTDEHVGKMLEITSGTGSIAMHKITANTADTFTVQGSFDVTPDNTSVYRVGHVYSGKSQLQPRQE